MNKILIVLITLMNISSYSQSDSFKIDFYELEPIWEHIFITPTSSIDSNKNFHVTPGFMQEEYQYLYILNALNYNSNADFGGYRIDKLNKNNGEKIWFNHSTALDSLQEYYRYIEIKDEKVVIKGSIRTQGFKPKPAANDIWSITKHSGKLSTTIFNKNNGTIDFICDKSDTSVFCPIYLQQFENDNKIIIKQYAHFDPNNTKDLANMAFYFYDTNESCEVDYDSPIAILPYESEDSLKNFSLEHQLPILASGKDKIAAIVIQGRKDDTPYRFQLIWFDISDLQNIKIINKVNYEDIIPFTNESLITFRNFNENDELFVTHRYFDSTISEKVNYLLWLDTLGAVKSMVNKCIIEDHPYTFLFPIYADSKLSYFTAHPTKTGRSGFDIVKLESGKNELGYISSITSKYSNETFNANFRVHKLLENGNLIIGSQSTIRSPGTPNDTRTVYYCFDGKKLGIEIPTLVPEIGNNKFTISPNPSASIIEIKTDADYDEVIIYNLEGKIVKYIKSNDPQIDISSLADATYICEIKKDGKVVGSGGRFVKVE